ncbi:MAG TPA: recombinase family protein [Thermoanaerobacterales bacterium]|jgi:DNA invertase Pin-like site-specific DNA recombinase|nr:recombinase family protein [Desulfitobacteriaceae bacterium]HHX24981.1 recombinase family protein [Thermoanaerobacterales bacterium]
MKKATEKYTILYARLSQDDGSQGDSNSIQNQRMMLEKYAKDNGFENLKFLYDDGATGTNFNRPAFQEVMALIENGEASTLIVKDMSRLGREYLEVGRLTEIVFPSYGVRFIAMNDGVDSLYGDNEFTPFKNIINEWYAKDCSKKGKASARIKAESGARVGSRPPFGYQKDPADPKRKIVPDGETAPIIKHIFSLCMNGKGPSQIANQLKEEQIPIPAYFYYKKNGVKVTGFDADNPCDWKQSTVARLLENEVYLGHTINLKYTTLSYKNKKRVERPESEQVRIENTHEAIIEKATWDIVQDIRKRKRRRANMAEQNIFSGLIYCKDCKTTMVLHRAHTMDAVKNNFACRTYKKKGKDACTGHFIREVQLTEIILDDLRRVTHFARQNEAVFAKHITQKNSAEIRRMIGQTERELESLKRRDAELSALFKRLYEDNVLGKIPNEVFRKLSDDYLLEQKEIQVSIPEKEQELEKLKDSVANTTAFLEKAKQYTKLDTLTTELLNLFIERVEIGEREERYSRTAPQSIDIYYRDIGLLDNFAEAEIVMEQESTPEEVA